MDQHATTPFQTWTLKQPTTSEYRLLVLTTGEAPSQLQELRQHYLSVSIHHREYLRLAVDALAQVKLIPWKDTEITPHVGHEQLNKNHMF